MGKSSLSGLLKNAFNVTGVSLPENNKVSLYALRFVSVDLMVQSGLTIVEIQQRTGHRSNGGLNAYLESVAKTKNQKSLQFKIENGLMKGIEMNTNTNSSFVPTQIIPEMQGDDSSTETESDSNTYGSVKNTDTENLIEKVKSKMNVIVSSSRSYKESGSISKDIIKDSIKYITGRPSKNIHIHFHMDSR